MIKTKILTDGDPLESVLRGAEILYKAVSTTMGPRGRNVIFRKHNKRVGITHDGVTVAKLVKLDDDAEDVGADLLREAAMKLDITTGDGTTTVVVLAYHILKKAAEYIQNGENPMKLKLALDDLQGDILDKIDNIVDKDVTEDKLIQVASVAAGDYSIGKSVGKVIFEAGPDTPIMLGFSENGETRTEIINGFKINAGAASPYLYADSAGVKVEIDSPKIIVVDAKLRDKEDVMPLLSTISQLPAEERKFLLVCADIAGDALSLMVINHLKRFAQVAVARVPESISSQTDYLNDVAISCGAQLLSRNAGNSIKEPKLEHFGQAKRVTVEPRETVIIEGKFIPEDMDSRVEALKKFKKGATDAATRKFADDRLKTLDQKIVSIYVGGQSETDAEERHYRYEDAVGASRAALRGGVVPGGGTLLWAIAESLEQSTVGNIMREALRQPILKILDNAGLTIEQQPWWKQWRHQVKDYEIELGMGIDVMHPEYGVIDLVKAGILDPAESEIECVKTAIILAGLLMTGGALIVDTGEIDEPTFEQQTRASQG